MAVFVSYLLALYLNVRFQLYKKTIFPLLLVLSGGCNHLLVLAARWIFLKDEYGMSSRYEIQYQMGIVGYSAYVCTRLECVPGKGAGNRGR